MGAYVEKTIVVSAPKRSGGTLLTNLFDSHPGIIDFIDEAFFWEHVYNYQERGEESLFVDAFKSFGPEALEASIIDRGLLPWIDGTFRAVNNFKLDLGFKRSVFLSTLNDLQYCSTISEIWDCLIRAYASASSVDYRTARTAFVFGGDYGRGMLATKTALKNCKCIFIIRNPYFALESLKKSRLIRNEKVLHPINFAQAIRHYSFFWNRRSEILDKRTILLRFEDLVTEPQKTMKIVARHVGVEYTDNLVTPTLRGNPWRGDSSFGPLKGIDKSVINRKIEVLNEREKEFIHLHLKPILEHFDYKIT